MRVSLNWIKFIDDKYGCAANPAPDGVGKLVEKIGAQLGAVEEVVDLGKKYEGILVVKVVTSQKHPNADKLHVCLIDDNGANKKVKRSKEGLIEIVCGAPNVKAGMLAAWIPPGVTVPATIDKDPLVLEAREIRGKISNGMLASPKELALGDGHEGLLVIDDENVKPGASFAKVYGLDDYIIDIENKMFTHRPDLFGMLGIAREIAGIQGQVFKSPSWYRENISVDIDGRAGKLKLIVKNELPKLVPRFCAVALKDVKVGPSPVWLQVRLNSAGIKSINNIVDITNFFMMETSQPLHAYDYDKLKTGILGVRLSKKGEELTLLGGKTVKLDAGAVVITNGHKPIGLGGVMGGADTEVDAGTKNIVLECANFDMDITRKTAMAYGLFTDAATRFTKGQSPRQTLAVLAKAMDDIKKIAGGRAASSVIDDKNFNNAQTVIKTDADFINQRLGLKLSAAAIKKLLKNVEFDIKTANESMEIRVPFWRTDIEIPEDIVEEVGRLYGYDHLPLGLPWRDLTPAKLNDSLLFKQKIREILSASGANEVLTYSFVHGSLIERAGQDQEQAYHIRNALSPDLQYYRQSLTPSLLEKIHRNVKEGFDDFVLFEMGTSHIKGVLDKEKLPAELERLSAVMTARSQSKESGTPYYAAKHILDNLLNKLNVSAEVEYLPLGDEKKVPLELRVASAAFEPTHSAVVRHGQKIIGLVGEPTLELRTVLKLPKDTAQLELNMQVLKELSSASRYQPLNRFPGLDQDFCLRSDTKYSYGELTDFMRRELDRASREHDYSYDLAPLDIFRKDSDKLHKQTTWRITLWHPRRTLTTEESNRLLDKIAKGAKVKLNADRI